MTSQNNTQKRIYLDNGASTAVDERVVSAMQPFWGEHIGNAGSLHTEGRYAKKILEESRAKVAHILNTEANNIIFTSGGTESNNHAVFGVVEKCVRNGKRYEDIHIITSAVEHNSISDCYRVLERKGVRITYIPVDSVGRVHAHVFEEALTEDTVLVSFIYVNNEIGTIENIQALKDIVQKFRKKIGSGTYPLIHTDASQAPAWLSIDVKKLGVDLLTVDSQKIYGPKGSGCLFVRNIEVLEPLMRGGGQEFGLRPGTPPLPLIVGLTKALELVEDERETYVKEVTRFRDWFVEFVLKKIPNVTLNGAIGEGRVAGNINLTIPDIDDEQLIIELDEKGIAASTRSACLSEDGGGSRVIQALNNGSNKHGGAVRLTLSRHTTQEEIEMSAQIFVETVAWLQKTH